MTCPLFVELCAGTAALSLRLHRRHARPPVSRMGAKTGYADAILRVLGLRPGQGAARYLWCEPDAARSLAESSAPDPTKMASVAKLWADYPQLWGGAESEADPAAATMAALVAEAARADSIRRVMGET